MGRNVLCHVMSCRCVCNESASCEIRGCQPAHVLCSIVDGWCAREHSGVGGRTVRAGVPRGVGDRAGLRDGPRAGHPAAARAESEHELRHGYVRAWIHPPLYQCLPARHARHRTACSLGRHRWTIVAVILFIATLCGPVRVRSAREMGRAPAFTRVGRVRRRQGGSGAEGPVLSQL